MWIIDLEATSLDRSVRIKYLLIATEHLNSKYNVNHQNSVKY